LLPTLASQGTAPRRDTRRRNNFRLWHFRFGDFPIRLSGFSPSPVPGLLPGGAAV
jgi:hypothetical protein